MSFAQIERQTDSLIALENIKSFVSTIRCMEQTFFNKQLFCFSKVNTLNNLTLNSKTRITKGKRADIGLKS